MSRELCVQDVIRMRYSFPRIQWLMGTMSVVSLLYLSSEEIWTVFDGKPFPEVMLPGIILYIVFFFSMGILANYLDTKRLLIEKRSVVITSSLISLMIDMLVICASEFVVLISIQEFPTEYLKGIVLLLLGATPTALGSIVLTSLTAETLKKRAQALYEDVQNISKQMKKLEDQRKKTMKQFEEYDKKRKEFENYFKEKNKENKSDENGN